MKKTILVLFLFILAIALIGCSNSSSGNTDSGKDNGKSQKIVKKEGKDITIAVADNFISMDPHDTNDTLSYSAQKTMMEGLVGFDKDMNVIPVLAKEYSANDEATEFTFKLQEGVKFHDGTPFNAEAVKANLDRLSDPDSKLIRASLFQIIKETKVVDEYTVKVTLSEPFGAMINTFAHPAGMMISPKALKEYGNDVSQHPVGTGPYVFKEWQPGDYLTATKNEEYWNTSGDEVDSITFKPTPENGSRIAMLQTGEADFIYPVPTEQAKSINNKDGIVVENSPSIVTRYMAMNTMKKPFNDIKVRQAINYAINKEAFINVVVNGYAEPMDSVIAPNTKFYSKQDPYKFDLEKAKKLMKEAGYEEGFETTLWGGNNSASTKAMEFIQQQLDQINIKVEVVPMESGTLSDSIWSVENPDDAKLEMYYGGWSPSTGDADWGIRPLLGGKSAFPPNSYNTAYYDEEEVNNLIEDALATADEGKREQAYADAQKKLWDDVPWAFLAVDDTIFGKKNYLEGIYLLPDGSLSLENMKIVQ
ncbi:glutathione ABC transporter substrate-binding protein GsiB [Virgibacillus dakarensis]|uniref:Glutathione-binding protein GsiB n=1 Tax=Lentibacillus populi TaxID=1827502 RepID=A0A9W5TUP5_9BACI|nr:glutathione ABC transporter substrate-binding protein [Lentibacillus populi]MTW87196.1 glutathione ABC transporter substrate-binding protein GsiB [Virgibacillus dakarensis]GGB31960.1 glutathione ABC transporter substrate-binding protein [Lentibacillus populi]